MTDLSKLSVAELRLALADHTHCISVGGYYAHITATQVFDELARRLEEAQRGCRRINWRNTSRHGKPSNMEQESKVEAGLGRTYWMVETHQRNRALVDANPSPSCTVHICGQPIRTKPVGRRELAEKNAALAVCANALALYANAKEIYHAERISDYASEVLENLSEFVKHAAKVIEAAVEHYEIEKEKTKKGHDGCDCVVC